MPALSQRTQPIRSIRVAHFTFVLYVVGLPLFIGGLALGHPMGMMFGAATFGTALLAFVVNVAATLTRGPRRDVTWWALAGALAFLVVTLALGLTLAGNLRWGFLRELRFLALGVHLHVALGGWVLLVIIGVAQKLLPMFLLSHGGGDRPARAAVALIAAGAAWLTFFHHLPGKSWRVAAALLGAGLACFLGQAWLFYRRRHRPALDPGMRLAAAGLGLLASSLILAAVVATQDVHPRVWTAYVSAVVLGISLFVAALYYKIVPFLVWYHRFGPLAGTQAVPQVAELYSAPVAHASGLLLVLGAVGLTGAVLVGQPGVARLAAVVLAGGVVTEAFQMFQLSRSGP